MCSFHCVYFWQVGGETDFNTAALHVTKDCLYKVFKRCHSITPLNNQKGLGVSIV